MGRYLIVLRIVGFYIVVGGGDLGRGVSMMAS